MVERGTPEWWRDSLLKRLAERTPSILTLDNYYSGNHPLPESPTNAQGAYRDLLRRSRSNWMALVVEAVVERLHVDGFRFGESIGGDGDAWKRWQVNRLDADSELVHTDALARGYSYVLVDPFTAQITVEDALQCIVAYQAGDRRRRAAGLKVWVDDDTTKATLYLPGTITKWQRKARAGAWGERVENGDDGPELDNPLGEVPLVEFRANPRIDGTGRSEFADVIPIQDRINETIFNRLVAARFSSFKQRWVTGLEVPVDPNTGQPVEPFKTAVDRLWVTDNPDAKFGEFSASDLSNYTKSVEADVQHLAAITRTPPHYLLGQSGAFPSGESLKSTETGLVAKCGRHQRQLGEAWEEVMRLDLRVLGDPKAGDFQSEVIWRDAEARTEGELVDALVKMGTLGVPAEVLWQRWGASQQEIARWKQMQAGEALRAAIDPRNAVQPQP